MAVFVGGKYTMGAYSMTAVEASTVAVAAAMVVAAVVVLIWLWRWLSWRADWLPSTPYKRNKILYVTNPCDIL